MYHKYSVSDQCGIHMHGAMATKQHKNKYDCVKSQRHDIISLSRMKQSAGGCLCST